MGFGDILEQWEEKQKKGKNSRSLQSNSAHEVLRSWLEENTIEDKEQSGPLRPENEMSAAAKRRKQLRELKPQAELDLHGFIAEEAITTLDRFIKDCKQKGLKKVLIIHGKGHHSSSGPVLKREVRKYLETSPLTGEMGEPERSMGGTGAVWVIIRS